MMTEEVQKCANAVRFLSIDAVQKANSGHPGMPMGMADIATVLWRDYLQFNPLDPNWSNRDRFILSNGHGSMLLYSLLHLSGYALSLDELKNFRQLHSATPDIQVHGTQYLLDTLSADDKLLIVDDVFATGRNVLAVLDHLKSRLLLLRT